jgi:hypothetical protein
MLIEFIYTFEDDVNGAEHTSEPIEFKDWSAVFTKIGRKTFLAGAHVLSLQWDCKPVVLKGFRRRHDREEATKS